MLTIFGGPDRGGRFCDGVSRRDFLKIGGLAMGGLSLPQLLQAQAQAGGTDGSGSHKALIMVYLPGGPPHQDMYDIKLDAPREIRGEFEPIATNVPGIEICELLPGMARNMDKLAIIRSIVGAKDRHESFQCLTGRMFPDPQPLGGWPEMGSAISKMQGATSRGLPPFVSLSPRMQHTPYNRGGPGFLGSAHAPFNPQAEGKDDLVLQDISLERLADRRALLSSLDNFRRQVDQTGMMEGLDEFTQQAFGLLTSSRMAEALDLEREDRRVRDRYGYGTDRVQGDAAPRLSQQFLLARRLVEAGVRCVTLSYSFWDWHGRNFQNARANLPDLDQAVTALVEDLHDRGLDQDVSVVVWGEFGRTPKINNNAGRDHWPQVSCALLAGGGMRTGQVIGATNRLGEYAQQRPVHFQEVFATLYQNLGIDVHRTTLQDLRGRPQYLIEEQHSVIPELV